jgi:regulator of cell morphogenesis and NO signaling
MYNLSNKTLSQIVTDHYQAARVFEKYQLDFCCKGKRSLESACAEFSLPMEDILNELSELLSNDNNELQFDQMSIAELTGYIVRVHHTYVKLNAPMIANYALKVATKHGERFPYMVEVYTQFCDLMKELYEHMEKEEKVLFPNLVAASEERLSNTEYFSLVEPFEHEHEHSGSIIEQISGLTNNYEAPEQACTTFRLALESLRAFQEDLHKHVHLENNILFPKAARISLS